jgi:hypothetical protein
MALRAVIEENPDGWNYRWWEDTIGGTESRTVIWSGIRGTFEGALEAVRESVREKLPMGHLQNDDEVPKESTVFVERPSRPKLK